MQISLFVFSCLLKIFIYLSNFPSYNLSILWQIQLISCVEKEVMITRNFEANDHEVTLKERLSTSTLCEEKSEKYCFDQCYCDINPEFFLCKCYYQIEVWKEWAQNNYNTSARHIGLLHDDIALRNTLLWSKQNLVALVIAGVYYVNISWFFWYSFVEIPGLSIWDLANFVIFPPLKSACQFELIKVQVEGGLLKHTMEHLLCH